MPKLNICGTSLSIFLKYFIFCKISLNRCKILVEHLTKSKHIKRCCKNAETQRSISFQDLFDEKIDVAVGVFRTTSMHRRALQQSGQFVRTWSFAPITFFLHLYVSRTACLGILMTFTAWQNQRQIPASSQIFLPNLKVKKTPPWDFYNFISYWHHCEICITLCNIDTLWGFILLCLILLQKKLCWLTFSLFSVCPWT